VPAHADIAATARNSSDGNGVLLVTGLAVRGRMYARNAIEEYDRWSSGSIASTSTARPGRQCICYSQRPAVYDSKAILGVKLTDSRPACHSPPASQRRGVTGAGGVLHKLGFEIRNVRETTGAVGRTGAGSPSSCATVCPALTPSAPVIEDPRSPEEALPRPRRSQTGKAHHHLNRPASSPAGKAPNSKEETCGPPELRKARENR